MLRTGHGPLPVREPAEGRRWSAEILQRKIKVCIEHVTKRALVSGMLEKKWPIRQIKLLGKHWFSR